MKTVATLFHWLKKSGVTIKQFAEDTGVSERTLKRIKAMCRKQTKYRPSLATLRQIMKATEFDLSDLLFPEESLETN